jgi:hypothetical protein
LSSSELDIDLLKEEELYDVNIIGSMLKAWLRELPDELFPKASQDRVARECTDHDKVPQVLIDELSNLPPFNYFLLFAITCHLSLLLSNSAQNKMDFRNLCICFQPCLKIDAFCFKFLVVDWRDCWKGCNSEDEWIAREYALWDLPPPTTGGHGFGQPPSFRANPDEPIGAAIESQDERPTHEERTISSSDSSYPPSKDSMEHSNGSKSTLKSRPPNLSFSQSNNSIATASEISSSNTASTIREVGRTPVRANGDITLAPIQPMSPMTLS